MKRFLLSASVAVLLTSPAALAQEPTRSDLLAATTGHTYASPDDRIDELQVLVNQASKGSGTLVLLPGLYHLPRALELPPGLRLIGHGVTMRPSIGYDGPLLVGVGKINSNRNGRTIEGISFRFAGTAISGTWHWSTLRDLSFADCKIGIDAGPVGLTVERSHFESNQLHLKLSGTASTFRDCTFFGGRGEQSMRLVDVKGLTFDGCVIERNKGPMYVADGRLIRFLGGWIENNGGESEIELAQSEGRGVYGLTFDGVYFAARPGTVAIVHGLDFATSTSFRDIGGNLQGAALTTGRVVEHEPSPLGLPGKEPAEE